MKKYFANIKHNNNYFAEPSAALSISDDSGDAPMYIAAKMALPLANNFSINYIEQRKSVFC